MSRLKDSFGRVIDDLRISLTDRCNFRCVYCMPAEGLAWLPKREILTYEELLRLAHIFIDLGIRTVRLTGGEPLMRQDIDVLIEGLIRLAPDLDLSMTTNGFLLKEKAPRLAEAGLKRINVSLDSLQSERFERMVRRDGKLVFKILDGLQVARAAGLHPIKLNCVVMRGYNEDELVDFARLGREQDYQVRFIEYMPLDAQGAWNMQAVVPGAEVLARIHAVFPLVPASGHGTEPATVYRFTDGRGSIGVIASVTEPFCDSCNRIRITADGQLRTCLFSLHEYNLKGLLRSGATDEEIADFILAAVWKKEAGHKINQPDFVKPARSMSAIGG
ncbi:MAG: GTP 3',8-cyclase MoaA [candidate division NC10 bacterium]|nr:GTP 3',8-cyclase MoaA [candidate division NC10 bacterium]MBI2114194.1 GTP 3',8-cyclase MoaA [candidate division NC10 bacterium]MBI2164285.1 GTP 3',8-cyclase MoaA [candidate division NC10 bacterium]MBI2454755.1 GTP 3',8-cyclase MoaA [candidate division NC10 bacterium]MBI3087249.1 GTP 3',8-cyclase MoaA [candidate division NC10 bacterium]